MAEINLLRALPHTKRNIEKRYIAKDPNIIQIAKQYGAQYFDGNRDYGYGGYYYDGRWVPVARDIVDHFQLKSGDKVLDIGCGKGFLVKDLMYVCPGLQVYGLDISQYAIQHCDPKVTERLIQGSGHCLPFSDHSFDVVLSLNTIHNFSRGCAILAMREIERVSMGKAFVQVDSYHNPEQKEIFESWVLTAEFHDYPSGWIKLFKEAGYSGDYYWTVINS